MVAKLVLFDIDETLIIGTISKDDTAFQEALQTVYNVSAGFDIINVHGLSDKKIMTEILKKLGCSDMMIESGWPKFQIELMAAFKKDFSGYEVKLLPGVATALAALDSQKIALGLATGNLKEMAEIKLAKVDLNKYFKFGGYGEDGLEREELVKKALKRAEPYINNSPGTSYLVGDSPFDIESGLKNNLQTIGVTTGVYSEADLQAAGADFVVNNLDEILNIIL